jgi:hypothetical protein
MPCLSASLSVVLDGHPFLTSMERHGHGVPARKPPRCRAQVAVFLFNSREPQGYTHGLHWYCLLDGLPNHPRHAGVLDTAVPDYGC